MKRSLLALCVIVLAADLALAQAGWVCLFADPQGNNCTINDPAPGLIQVYVVHVQASNVKSVEFKAAIPACMEGAIYLADSSPYMFIGNSQNGVSIGYGACLTSPINVLRIDIFGMGQTLPDCPYEVLPHPMSGVIGVTDCDDNPLVAQGGTTFINPFSLLPCVCGVEGPPLLNVSPTTLEFGEIATTKSFVIGNFGGGVLTWELSESADWLGVAPSNGVGNATVHATVDRSGLAPGSYTTGIAVTSNGGSETVTVNMQVPSPNPVLGVSPASLSFSAAQTVKTLNVFNAGSGELYWTITTDQSWLTADPASGANDTQVWVQVDRTGLAGGTYYGNVLVESNGGDATVPVEMVVDTDPVLSVSPTTLVFSPIVTTRTFSITNTGYGTLEWSLVADQTWIEIVPPLSGTGNATVTVNVDPGSVPGGGVQTGFVTVTSNGGAKLITVRYDPGEPVIAGSVGLFADPNGLNCNILDEQQGTLSIYVVHLNTLGATGLQFAAPMPPCMTGATWVNDVPNYPVTVGNSQTGVSVGYGACLTAPIHVLTIEYLAAGLSEVCCQYPVIAAPGVPSGKIEVSDCNYNVVYAHGGTSVVNPDDTCECGSIKIHETTWGRVKALYAPE